jgi:hypothetical protein
VIVCKTCGYHNAGSDSFCGSCGAFLEWTGEKVEVPKPVAAPAPEPEPEPEKKGLLAKVQSLLYADVGEREPVPRASGGGGGPAAPGGAKTFGIGPKGAGPAKSPVPPPPGGGLSKPPPPPPPGGGLSKPPVPPPPGAAPVTTLATEAPAARPLVAPLTAASTPPPPPAAATPSPSTWAVRPAGADPGVVAPQEHGRARMSVPRSAPTRRLEPGDLVCGDCGEGNLPTRRFCSRCGNELAGAEVVRASWWRRMVPHRKPRAARSVEPETGVARTGQRRARRKSVFPAVRRTVAVLVVFGGVAYAALPPVRQMANTAVLEGRQRATDLVFGKYEPVRAVTASATTADRRHPATAAVDGYWNTYWATTATGSPQLKLVFQEPVELRKALIRGGIAGNLQGSQRPRTLHLVYPSGVGQDLNLADKTDPQEFELDSKGKVSSVEIYVQATYANAASKQVAISEIELFVKQ